MKQPKEDWKNKIPKTESVSDPVSVKTEGMLDELVLLLNEHNQNNPDTQFKGNGKVYIDDFEEKE